MFKGGIIAQWLANLLPDPDAPGSIPSFLDFLEVKLSMSLKVIQQRCFEESGQKLDNVVRTHLVVASGKIVLKVLNLTLSGADFAFLDDQSLAKRCVRKNNLY